MNWDNVLPSAVLEPMILGETDGRRIVYLISGYAVNGLKKVDISFFWEKQNG